MSWRIGSGSVYQWVRQPQNCGTTSTVQPGQWQWWRIALPLFSRCCPGGPGNRTESPRCSHCNEELREIEQRHEVTVVGLLDFHNAAEDRLRDGADLRPVIICRSPVFLLFLGGARVRMRHRKSACQAVRKILAPRGSDVAR